MLIVPLVLPEIPSPASHMSIAAVPVAGVITFPVTQSASSIFTAVPVLEFPELSATFVPLSSS